MARIRTIKPDFWKHEALSALPEATHMLAAALLNYADDYGYFNANPLLIKSECFPLREPLVSIPESLRSLQEIGYIQVATTADGRRFGRIVHFAEHQRVSHATPSKIQAMSIDWNDSGAAPEKLLNPPETFRPEGNRREEEGKKKDAAPSARPDSDEVQCFARAEKLFGKKSGGFVVNLVKAKGGNYSLALAALATASTKQNPREYIGAIIKGADPPDDARARGDAW